MQGRQVSTQFKFVTLPQRSGTVANVFIHGYSAGHDMEDRCALRKHIPSSLHNCINIFAYWPSGHWSQFDEWSTKGILAAGRLGVLAAAGAAVADRALHFNTSRKRATAMGKLLLTQLEAYILEQHPYVSTVNLVGHSLGGRVVVSALRDLLDNPDHDGLEVGDVLLMAAAVELSGDEACAIGKRINGKLFNAYSRSDKILLLNLGETSAGRNPLENCEHIENITNREMTDFDHTDYWPRLERVLRATGFYGYQGGLPVSSQSLPMAETADPVEDDHLLFHLLELTTAPIQSEVVKHLRTSSWTSLETDNSLYLLTKELQLLGGHCLVNMARRRGLKYVQILLMLAEHFELVDELHDCARVIELEALLISQFFKNSFGDNHVFASKDDVAEQVLAMSQKGYFDQVDALAASLTVTSYFSTTEAPAPAYREAVPGLASMNKEMVLASTLTTSLSALLPTERMKTVMTNFKSAVKPGYSALIPAVAILFYARLKLNNEGLL
jgi:pimeloyl-ACP methyl ester carboxylesterase